jgi:DNA invertase Pin-like site-specific DNA recombinase
VAPRCVFSISAGETVDAKSATGKLILTIFAGYAQFETRDDAWTPSRRHSQGASGGGGTKAAPKSALLLASEARQMVSDGKSITEAAKALGTARASVYRALEAA